tara:strand:- start:1957 stop:2163 length:207 start_codon:yes stop_codon:yes gene_type:complete
MIDPFIIEYLKKKREERSRDKRIPLQAPLPMPRRDDRRDRPGKDTNNKGYIEIDIIGDSDDEPNVIDM